MTNTIEGDFETGDWKIAIVASRWNGFFAEQLLSGAVDILQRHGIAQANITVFRCPGCFEIPQVTEKVVATGKFDAIVCLGVLIRGSTPHFDYIASEATKGISASGVRSGIPVTYGVITCDTLDQAVERSGSKAGNKGVEAAMAALEMLSLYEKIGATR
jgi:6,7-dimethyl-8-ribityllumazine synthase